MKLFLTIIFLLFLPAALMCLELEYSNRIDNSWLILSAAVTDYDTVNLQENLDNGQKVEIRYELCLYEDIRGFFSIFRNKLIFSQNENYVAYKHLFSREYIIEKTDKSIIKCDNYDAFLEVFFKLSDYKFYKLEKLNLKNLYLYCRVTFIPIKLEPPLKIISFLDLTSLFARLDSTSVWVKHYIHKPAL